MTSEEYAAKLEAKRERLEERASKLRREAIAADKTAHRMMDIIPTGQPILVGHHSERRHRRDLARIDSNLHKAVDTAKHAAQLEVRAAHLGEGGISSDDPGAVGKLQEKLLKLETQREEYKAYNKRARKEGTEQLPKYVLANMGGNIRSVKMRIEALQKEATAPELSLEGEGWKIEENGSDNRIRVYFDTRPDSVTCSMMKRLGFKWAPSVGAWQRMLNPAGRHAARDVASILGQPRNEWPSWVR